MRKNKELFYTAVILPFLFFYTDRTIFVWMRYFSTDSFAIHPVFQNFGTFVKYITHGTTLTIIIFIFCIAGKLFHQILYETSVILLKGFLSSGIIVQALKHLIGRARPRLTVNYEFIGPSFKSGYDSFPSGHTAVVFCLAYILSLKFPRYKIVFYLFAALAGFERVISGSHFPSDVIAGAVVGLIIGKIITLKTFQSQKNYISHIKQKVITYEDTRITH